MMRRYVLSIGLIAALCVLPAACKKEQPQPAPAPAPQAAPEPPEKPSTSRPPALPTTRSTATSTAPTVQAPATRPAETLVSIESLPVPLRPAAGRALAVVFWHTRDPEMNAQAKAASVLYRRFHGKGLDMVSICADPGEDRIIDYAERWQFPWPQVMNAAAPDPKPFDRFKIEKTPACLLIKPTGDPIPLKLDMVDDTHAAVAKVLDVNLADLAMPEAPSRNAARERRQGDAMSEFQQAVATKSDEEAVSDAIIKVFEEDDSRARVDEVADLLCESMSKQAPKIIEKTLEKVSPQAQIRMVRAVMVKSGDGLECLMPTVKKLGDDNPALEQVTRWDRSQLGRALVLAGEFEKAAKLLRKIAEDAEGDGAWWYMVGWAEACGGRADPAKEAFAKSYQADGEYSGSSAKLAGHVAGYFLGKTDEKAFLEAEDAKVGQFFIGERHMLAGEKEQAVEAYKASVKAGEKSSDPWPANWARLRLKQYKGEADGLPKPLPPAGRFWLQASTAQTADKSGV